MLFKTKNKKKTHNAIYHINKTKNISKGLDPNTVTGH